jgi:hypothetical protein
LKVKPQQEEIRHFYDPWCTLLALVFHIKILGTFQTNTNSISKLMQEIEQA